MLSTSPRQALFHRTFSARPYCSSRVAHSSDGGNATTTASATTQQTRIGYCKKAQPSPVGRKRMAPTCILGKRSRPVSNTYLHDSASLESTIVSTARATHLGQSSSCILNRSVPSSATAASRLTSKSPIVITAEAPSITQLRGLFVSSAVPMIGFGFMDNFIMITAGGYIDATLGVQFGLATMTAAAIGQIFSDVGGVLFGGAVERGLVSANLLRPTHLSSTQRKLPICRNVCMSGAVLGVATGCILGATSLWMFDLEKGSHKSSTDNREKVLNKILSGMLHSQTQDSKDEHRRVKAQRRSIFLVKKRGKEHYLETICDISDNDRSSAASMSRPRDSLLAAEQCFHSNSIVKHEDELSGKVSATLCVPVQSTDSDEVIAVLEFYNEDKDGHFNDEDINSTQLLASHVGIVLQEMNSTS